MNNKAKIALIGGGYSLELLAQLLKPEDFLITSRSIEKVAAWRKLGWTAEVFDFSSTEDISKLLSKYVQLKTWVDSIPPFSELHTSIKYWSSHSSNNIAQVVYLSTTGVYGVTTGEWVDENTPLSPAHNRSEARVLAEKLYHDSGIETCALRISGIYGPGRGPGISLKRGNYPYVSDGQRWSNRIHVEDLVQVVKLAIEQPSSRTLPQAINVSDDCPSLVSEVVNFYCEQYGFDRPKSITIEQALQQGMFTIIGNQRVSNKLLHQTFSIQLKYPSYRQGAGSEFCVGAAAAK